MISPKFYCPIVLIAFLAALAHAADFNVKQLGAVGDGKASDTQAIQKAIDDCSKAGGGTVNVPAGQYVVATVQLKDNVTLHLDEKAELLGTLNLPEYRNVDPFKDGLGASVGWAMIVAVDAKHIAITGPGSINGQGKAIAQGNKSKGQGWGNRPFLVRLVRCNDVTLRDVELHDAGAWTTNLFQSDNVTIDHVKINSHVAPHNDGIDIDSCQHIHITNCDIESGDDSICLKTTSDRPDVDITADGCRLKSNQGAIKLGTESYADFRDIHISNCQIRDTHNGGIKLLTVDGSHLENVTITDITMDNVRTPIFMRLGARLKTFRDGEAQKPAGTLKNILIKNVKAKAAAKSQLMPPSGIFITGIPDHPIEDLTLENIEIDLAGGGTAADAHAQLVEKIDTYPEIDRFGKTLPAYGLFARHVQNLTVKNFTLKLDASDLRPAAVIEDAAGIKFSDWTLPTADHGDPAVRLESVTNPDITGIPTSAIQTIAMTNPPAK